MNEIADFIKNLREKPILIYGLGKSGISLARMLHAAGAHVVTGDDNPENLEEAKKLNVEIYDNSARDFSEYAFVLLSPGIPFTHPKPHTIVDTAKEADVEIFCDVELFHRIYPNIKTIGVTGTNGKSTTATLIHHILSECGVPSVLCGNIGTPVFDSDFSNPDAWVVVEISSFQMDLCPTYRPDISAILNLTSDHIDRHGSMEQYAEVKERITELSNSSDYNLTFLGADDDFTKKISDRAKGLGLRKVIDFSSERALASGTHVENGILYDVLDGYALSVGDISEIPTLKGMHNYQNVACAYGITRKIGLPAADIWKAIVSFPGLQHRQYLIRTINGVGYINDSKSTNAAAAAVALGCRNNAYWIVGGRRKKNGLDGLEEFFPRIKHAFLIGEATEDFATWFDNYGMEYTRCYDLKKALSSAHEMAQENRGQPGGAGVVLLSPACASFDQFRSFEDRGEQFTTLVNALEE
ncbi:MAG: UDP-N-acetylmuramoyl-L-alanine--D-glutamate ligase [Alphaproteobacteria bacterium]